MDSPVHCSICKLRVSDWMMSAGKTLVVNQKLVHKACADDYRLKYGKEYDGKSL